MARRAIIHFQLSIIHFKLSITNADFFVEKIVLIIKTPTFALAFETKKSFKIYVLTSNN